VHLATRDHKKQIQQDQPAQRDQFGQDSATINNNTTTMRGKTNRQKDTIYQHINCTK